jgi:hypothetical protein
MCVYPLQHLVRNDNIPMEEVRNPLIDAVLFRGAHFRTAETGKDASRKLLTLSNIEWVADCISPMVRTGRITDEIGYPTT